MTSGSSFVDNTTPALARSWHVVATSAEVTAQPRRVQLLGMPWCLVRLDGSVVAYRDRCPHRLAPLSCGSVVGPDGEQQLRCGYHGWSFDRSGRCTDIPAVETSPPARARAEIPWAVEEEYGLVWMAPAEPLTGRHPFPEWAADGFDGGLCEVVRTPAGAAQLIDNFLDAAHFPFVHAATFGVDEAASVSDSGIDTDGWEVATTFFTRYREGGEILDQHLLKVGSASLGVYLRLSFPQNGLTIGILFCCTPEAAGVTRVYKLVARNDLAGDPGGLTRFLAEEDTILREDLAILERYDSQDLPLDRTVEIHTRADRLSLAWRTLMGRMVSAP